MFACSMLWSNPTSRLPELVATSPLKNAHDYQHMARSDLATSFGSTCCVAPRCLVGPMFCLEARAHFKTTNMILEGMFPQAPVVGLFLAQRLPTQNKSLLQFIGSQRSFDAFHVEVMFLQNLEITELIPQAQFVVCLKLVPVTGPADALLVFPSVRISCP